MDQDKINILYIAGSGRSGSTLLEQILGQLDGFTSIGELRHLWRDSYERLCSCGEKISECSLWKNVLERINKSGVSGDFLEMRKLQKKVDRIRYLPWILRPHLARPIFQKTLACYKGVLLDIYRSIQEQSGAKIIVDSSKDISTLYLLSTLPEINLHTLHLVMDSRGVAYSWQHRKKIRPEFTDRRVYMWSQSSTQAAFDWLYRNLMIHMFQRRAQNYFYLRYEDFVASPSEQIIHILNRLPGEHGSLEATIQDSNVILTKPCHTVSGNPSRFNSGRLKLALDHEWLQNMSRTHKASVSLITWPLLLRYKYHL